MRLIDADSLEKEFCSGCQYENNKYSNCIDCALAHAPTIEERKTGEWIEVNDHYNRISGRCSVCGWEALLYETDVVGMNYCPNCGAEMRGDEKVKE